MSHKRMLVNNCRYETDRLRVDGWKYYVSDANDEQKFIERIISILTPDVTVSLPGDWRKVNSSNSAKKWLNDRDQESAVLAIEHIQNGLVAGFLFLNEEYSHQTGLIDLRIGYLLSRETWGKGLGSELIEGLVAWCEKAGNVSSITGGIEVSNKASIRILEKNGFKIATGANPPEGTVFFKRLLSTGKA